MKSYYYKPEFVNYEEYYGLRDFYHLIKAVSKHLSENLYDDKQNLIKMVKRCIERNFGGNKDINGAQKLGELFS
jgi:hypothetical protein